MFKDCKTGGFNLEQTKVDNKRFLALVLLIAIAYTFTTIQGQLFKQFTIDIYAGRLQEPFDIAPRQSDFSLGLYGQGWQYAMDLWADLAFKLMALKPHKRLYFQRGLYALSLIQGAS